MKRFSEVYDQGYVKEEVVEDGYYLLSGSEKTSYRMKLLHFINENNFLSKLNDVFLFKVKIEDEFFYNCYFTYKGIKMNIPTIDFKNERIRIYTKNNEWHNSGFLDLDWYNINDKEIKYLKENVLYNIKNNTKDRLKFLLNEKNKH